MMEHHRSSNAAITVATVKVYPSQAANMGVVRYETSTGEVLELFEKPGVTTAVSTAHANHCAPDEENCSPLVDASAGVYAINIRALDSLLAANPNAVHMADDVIAPAAQSQLFRVQAYEHPGHFTDVTSLRNYHRAVMKHIKMDLESDPSRYMGCAQAMRAAPPIRLSHSQIDDALLGHGCIVNHACVERSVLGNFTYVGRGAHISDSVIFGSSQVQPMVPRERFREEGRILQEVEDNVVLRNAVLDYDVVIGEGSQLVNKAGVQEADLTDRFGFRISEGLIVASRGARVPPGTCV